MQIKDFKLSWWLKLVALTTLVIIVVNHTRLWSTISYAIAPVWYAFVLAYSLDYIVRFFEKRLKFPRGLAIATTLILFLMTLVLLGLVIVPTIVSAISSLIKAINTIKFDFTFLREIDFDNIFLNELQKSILDIVKPMLEKLTNATGTAVMVIISEVQRFTSGIISFVIAFIIAIYMLGEKKDLKARIKRTTYAYVSNEKADFIFETANLAHRIFKDFFIGKLLDSVIIGILTFIILTVFNFEFAVLIALIVGVTNMIPYFGPFIGAVPSVIITFIGNPTTIMPVIWVLVIILAIQQLDGWIIGPIILGDSVGVSAFWIIVAVTVGGATFGVAGMFLGVPVCVLIKTLIENDVDRKLEAKGFKEFEMASIKSKKK